MTTEPYSADAPPEERGGVVEVLPPPSVRGRALDRLDEELLLFEGDKWTIRDAVEGTQIFGGNGSGKSSGSGKTIAGAFVRHGFGGLVLTAKPDDLEQWVRYLEAQGLDEAAISERLVVVQPGSLPPPELETKRKRPVTPQVCSAFNFLDYEFAKTKGLTLELVSLFLDSLSPGGAAVSGSDPYWEEALRELLTHAIDLVSLASLAETGQARVRLSDILLTIRTTPQSPAQAMSSAWRSTTERGCWSFIQLVATQLVKPKRLAMDRLRDFSSALSYWTEHFPALADKTRSIIVSSLTAKAAGLLHSPIREFLCGDDDPLMSPAAPERTFAGKIVVINLPVKLFGEVGQFAQTILKTVWQRAVERRVKDLEYDASQVPVFLWADEAQYFINRGDARFQQTARSALAATVYLTQNISNYYAALPSGIAKVVTDSLVGNLQTKIFHASGDPATVEWAERLYGKTVRRLGSENVSVAARDGSIGRGTAATLLPVVEARHFASLRTGGRRNRYRVEAWVYKAGARWSPSASTTSALGYAEVPSNIRHCTFVQEVPDAADQENT